MTFNCWKVSHKKVSSARSHNWLRSWSSCKCNSCPRRETKPVAALVALLLERQRTFAGPAAEPSSTEAECSGAHVAGTSDGVDTESAIGEGANIRRGWGYPGGLHGWGVPAVRRHGAAVWDSGIRVKWPPADTFCQLVFVAMFAVTVGNKQAWSKCALQRFGQPYMAVLNTRWKFKNDLLQT